MILVGVAPIALTFARMYGAAALAIGFFAVQVWRNFDSEYLRKAFLQTFTVFHIGVAAAIWITYTV